MALAATATLICSSPFARSWLVSPAAAHEVEIADDVGGTLHIEPSDTPRAGEDVLAWVALRSQGGEIIGLEQCDCQLDVYSQPRQANSAPLLSPTLAPVEGDGIQGIPGAEFTFPNVGLYTLVMTGSSKQSGDFSPFELAFDVTVAAGVSAPAETPAVLPPPGLPETASDEATGEITTEIVTGPKQRPILLLFLGGMVIGAVGFLLIRRA